MDANELEYISIASGTFALANVPTLCAISPRLYISSGNKTVFCTLIGCLSDRRLRSDRVNACCMFTFDKQRRTLSVQWDHTSQIKRLFDGWHWQYSSLQSCVQGVPTKMSVELAHPDSLNKVADFIKRSALFHLRLGHNMAVAFKSSQEKDKA